MTQPYFAGADLARQQKRWGLRARDRFRWILPYVLPTTRVDRSWLDDDLDVYGVHASYSHRFQWDTVPQPQFLAWRLDAGFFEPRDAFIRRLQLRWLVQEGSINSEEWHLATTRRPDGYNPTEFDDGAFYPALYPHIPFRPPRSLVSMGWQSALPSANIGGSVITPFLGPRWLLLKPVGLNVSPTVTLLDWHDPPLRVKAGHTAFLQHINPATLGAFEVWDHVVFVECFFSEREVP